MPYYDPVIGRFYSNDPVDGLGHMQRGNSIVNGFNRYAYANNNPYKYTDPDGELPWAITGFLGGALNTAIEYASNDNATGKDLFVAFGKGFAVGATGTGAVNMMGKAMKLATASSKAGKGFAKAYAGSSVAFSTSLTVDMATNAAGVTDIDALDSMLNATANALGTGTGAKLTNAAKGLFKDTVSGTAGDITAAGTAKVADDKLKEALH